MFTAIRDVMIFHVGYQSLAEGMHDCGVDTVELRYMPERLLTNPTAPADQRESFEAKQAEQWEQLKQQFDAEGLKVGALLLATRFGGEDNDEHIQWVIDAVAGAEILGATAVRIDPVFSVQDLSWSDQVRVFSDAVLRILEATADSNIPLGIENHGRWGNDPALLGAILARVNSPRLGLTLDTGNFYWAGHPLDRVYQIIETFAQHVVHTHCKNICYPGYLRNCQRPLGYEYVKYVSPIPDGDIDHAKVVEILKAAGYEGGLYIEDESLGKAEDRKAQLKRDIEYLRSLTG